MKNYKKLCKICGYFSKNFGNLLFLFIFFIDPKIEFDKSFYPAKNGKIEESRAGNVSACREKEFFS
jgi:hypothetical protein